MLWPIWKCITFVDDVPLIRQVTHSRAYLQGLLCGAANMELMENALEELCEPLDFTNLSPVSFFLRRRGSSMEATLPSMYAP